MIGNSVSDAEQRARILSAFGFYRDAPADIRSRMEETSRVEHLPGGTYFFHEADDSAGVGIVHSGSIRVFKSGRTGREVTLFHVGPGEACLLNILTILTGRRFPATSRAASDVTVLRLPADEFRYWFETVPAVRAAVMELVGRRLAGLVGLIEEVTFERMDRRLAGFLLSRFAADTGESGVIRLTHEEIANQLGSAREVVGRLLKQFEQDGAITMSRGTIRLRDISRLDRRRPNHSAKSD